MSILKKLCVAALSAVATVAPVGAEVQPGTSSLLETIQANGIVVTINHSDCATDDAYGSYRWVGFQRELRLCPGDTIDATDHNTVRHEVIHAIQHCVNMARGTAENDPIILDEESFKAFVRKNLSQDMIDRIFEVYERDHWLVELEAFAGANAYTATELKDLFLQACVADKDGL